MTTRTFAPWVAPVAAQLREGRNEIVRAAQRFLPEFWGAMSPLEGWSYRDLLAHLANGDWALQEGLRIVIAGESLSVARFGDVDTVNARAVEEAKSRSIDELIAAVEAESAETQELLAQLTDEHEQYKPDDAPITLGEYLRMFPGHDRTHLEQLKTGLDNIML